jgi:predicted outer membrane repeat protein
MKKAVAAASAGNRLELRGTCPGQIAIGKNLTIVGVKTAATGRPTLTGRDQTRVLWIKEGATVRLSKLTIRDGFRPGEVSYPASTGAGILLDGTAILTDVVVRDNVVTDADTGGGGIEIQFPASRLTLQGASVMTGNIGGWGGAIENYGILRIKGSVRLHHNTAMSGGGAFYDGGTAVTIISGTARIDHNTAPDGGGIYLGGEGLTMEDDASIDQNTATVGSGGGIYRGGGSITGATCGENVHDNTPEDIAPDCS